jgi:4a-hydroxytetrahydrobiopterin dehydratase
MAVLSKNEIEKKLNILIGWKFSNNQIEKTFELKDFKSALKFVNELGDKAEEMNHHPDIFLFSWNKVKLIISTHDEGGVTSKDFTLASKIDSIN